ncbi:protein of unknown function [Methylorubrum extorquens DM4]|uniref:Uncharacterized protein n=1 Tax=Methylorubrum extorquens (strain DSM 6343 / CIP 106787 / DM4) TaxID=661410 RepID=C7C9A9_METED|nr:hypothetical protein [Methylorubrum extorquens]CAX22075.1 protein of unknown function [Methylorubrum extorquens DM4]
MVMRRDEFRVPAAVLRQHLAAGEGYAEISRRYDVGENAVRYRCRRLGLRELVNGRAPSEAALRMALSHSDIPLKAIARAFGVEASTLTRAARLYGLPTDEIGREQLRDAR